MATTQNPTARLSEEEIHILNALRAAEDGILVYATNLGDRCPQEIRAAAARIKASRNA